MRQATATARARLKRVQQDLTRLETQHRSLTQEAQQWEQRAADSAVEDEETALDCLRRRNSCRDKAASLVTMLNDQRQSAHQLDNHIRQAEAKLEELNRQRNLLRARESNAEASRTARQWEESGPVDVEAVLERWEGRILEAEPAQFESSIDELAERFELQETQTALRDELAALKNKQGEKSHD
jgi:phage shock protein A